MEQCNWFGVHMRFVGIMQGCKNPGDHVLYKDFSLSLPPPPSLCLSICVIIRKCSLQKFGEYNFENNCIIY